MDRAGDITPGSGPFDGEFALLWWAFVIITVAWFVWSGSRRDER